MRIFNLSKICVILLLSFICLIISPSDINAQRRERPGNMKNTNEYLDNVQKETPVTCTYIKSGASFSSTVYYYSEAGNARMKIGTATLSLSGNHYTLTFKSAKTLMRNAEYRGKKKEYNPWRMQNIANDFVQKGKYETFKKNNKYYLRLYDGDSDGYLTDVSLKSVDQKDFIMSEDGLSFEFTYN